ncbi:MAG TPA: hypothetical protein VFU74_13235 [Actinocrinis sp.]|nr:hypothetical protein [Actinocrinis sp.]
MKYSTATTTYNQLDLPCDPVDCGQSAGASWCELACPTTAHGSLWAMTHPPA